MKTFLRNNLQKQEEGFTLIELLVVIVIIGVLTAIAIPIFLNQQKAARTTQLKSDMKSVALAYETYKINNRGVLYPDVYHNWSNIYTNSNTLYAYFKPSDGTQIHAFDAVSYGSRGGITTHGTAFCIEGALDENSHRLYYASWKGGFSDSCY